MTRKNSHPIAPILMTILLGLASPALLACEKSGSEKVVDQAKDALDMREHEGLKDAGEDVQDAVEDAGSAIQEEADALKEKAK